MAAADLTKDLHAFALDLFERVGGIADWPAPDAPGSVLVPPAVAAAAHLPGEEFALSTTVGPGSLHVGLASEFMETAGKLLEAAVPRAGAFRISDRRLTGRDLSDKILQTFGWLNARGKCGAAEPVDVDYEQWTFHGSLRSEDVWEGLLRVSVNVASRAVIDLPDVFAEPDLRGDDRDGERPPPSTYAAAVATGKKLLTEASAEFVRRIEKRCDRDRKRLEDYYRALSGEADGPRRRTAAPPSPEEIAAKKRAVDLELRRKLAELNENYALRAVLQPLILARVRLPALVVPVAIQRKQAIRTYRLYWNVLMRKFEPLACSRCLGPTFSAAFADETVDLLCPACHERA